MAYKYGKIYEYSQINVWWGKKLQVVKAII